MIRWLLISRGGEGGREGGRRRGRRVPLKRKGGGVGSELG